MNASQTAQDKASAMTSGDAPVRLHAVQSFLRLPLPADGKPYGPGFFRGRDWRRGLGSENRRVTLRLAGQRTCAVCRAALSGSSTGDHIIPLADVGPVGAQNFLPLCRSCNASKGTRDLLDWMAAKSLDVRTVDLDILCAYARLKYAWLKDRGRLDETPSLGLRDALTTLRSQLPECHRPALDGLVCGGG
jgi:hypothetical protein